MLGAHDLEEFYEQLDERHERRHDIRTSSSDDANNCPVCAATKTARRLPFLHFGRVRRFG
jgi:hypothetical protein